MSNKGTAVLNFGAFPGSNEASAVISDTTITSGVLLDAWIRAEATSDHTIQDHTYAPCFIEITVGVANAGVGFTIYARCTDLMVGTWNIDWVWA